MSYTISKGQQGEKILMIDGIQSVCPFVNAIPFQGNMGQVQIMRMPCSTLCPHAKQTGNTYQISCGYDVATFEIEISDDEKESSSKLFSI